MSDKLDHFSGKHRIQNESEVNRKLIELTSLFEISQLLNSSLELKQVLNNMLLIPMGRLMIARGLILLKENHHFVPRLIKGVTADTCNEKFVETELFQKMPFVAIRENYPPELSKLIRFMQTNRLSISIPLTSQDQLIGVAFYGSKLNKTDFTAEEINFLTSLANISTPAIENAAKVEEIRRINQELDQRIQQLKTLFDIAQGLSATLDAGKIEKLLTYVLMGQMLVNHYVIVIVDGATTNRINCKGFNQETVELLSRDLLSCTGVEAAELVRDFPVESLRKKLSKLGARVFIPMRQQNKMLGLILLGEKINKKPFSDADLEFLTTLVSQAVVSLENARLFQETLEKERIEQELRVATNIQKKLLPREIPVIDRYDVWGTNIPSKEVGGDYFDIIQINENKFALAIGDVSGKSVPAALLMANLQAALRIVIDNQGLLLKNIVSKLNNLIHQNTDLDKYITFFIGILDVEKDELSFVNAGHNPPMLINSEGKINLLEVGGIILGMMSDFSYEMGTVKFDQNDLLVSYTDGVNEALNTSDEEFSEERLQEYVLAHRNLLSRPLAEGLIEEIRKFSQGAEQADDITLLIAKRVQ